ncbi:MAG: hypothetical protein ACRDK4_07990 [Solirubrobacteraceae bacterium]
MRKIQLIGAALLALLALGAVTASAAFAETELLLSGNPIAELINVEISGELGLKDDAFLSGAVEFLCTGFFDANIEPGGKLGFIEAVLNSSKELVSAEVTRNGVKVTGDDVSCESMGSGCMTPSLLVAVDLPWHFVFMLLEGTNEYMIHLLKGGEEVGDKEPGYVAVCETLLIGNVEDYCHGLTYAALANEVGGLLAEFSNNAEISTPGACSQGNNESGLLAGDGFIKEVGELEGEHLLTVSG